MEHRCVADFCDRIRNLHSTDLFQFFRQGKIIHICIFFIHSTHNGSGEFIRTCSRCDHSFCRVAGFFFIFVVNRCCNRGMRIEHIVGIFVQAADLRRTFLLCRIISVKITELFFHLCSDFIFAITCKRRHQGRVACSILSCNPINQPFQIARNQNIHRRGRCKDKITISVISTCTEEII